MTKFRGRNDPGYKAVLGELRRWVREIEENLTTASDPLAKVAQEGTTNGWMSSLPQGFGAKRGALTYIQNNSSGGLIIQGNNINTGNGSIYFGK